MKSALLFLNNTPDQLRAGQSLSLLENKESQSAPEWINVSVEVKNYPHAKGKFSITHKQHEEMLANFADFLPAGVVVDFEHQTLNTLANGRPAPATGWIKELKIESNRLWARVEWLETGKNAVENGEYKLLSPVFQFDYQNRKTGKRGVALHSVALTNTPNIKELQPITNKEESAMNEELKKALIQLFGLGEDATEEQIMNSAKEAQLAPDKPEEETPDPDSPEKDKEKDQSKKPDEHSEKPLTREEVEALIKNSQTQSQIDPLLTNAIKDGRIAEADRKDWEPLLKANFAAASAQLQKLPKQVPLGEGDPIKNHQKQVDNEVALLSNSEMAEQFGMTAADYKAYKGGE